MSNLDCKRAKCLVGITILSISIICYLVLWQTQDGLVESLEFCGTQSDEQDSRSVVIRKRVRRVKCEASRQHPEHFPQDHFDRPPPSPHLYLHPPHASEPHKNTRISSQGDSLTSTRNNQQQLDETSGSSEPKSRTIETAVFIDQALDTKFNGLSNGLVELNKLVLTIMHQVQYLFEYSSLQTPIRLKLVLIEHLKESERQLGLTMPNPERGDIDAYLSNFCNWQQNRLSRENRLWWDHAILLSG